MTQSFSADSIVLPRDSNQALGIAQFAIDFLGGKYGDNVDENVYEKVRLFHTDSVLCGVSALALKTNAPTILREEALDYPCACGARVFGSLTRSQPEKVVAANCAAVREWDSNGTVFGFNPKLKGHQAGEFGHNDFYPVVIAAAQAGAENVDGRKALRAMLCLDEIRGRLAEVFSLKSFKIDHVVYGAVASAAVYGALLGASAEQIESAIGLSVAHYIPWRAIRAGKQLSDSKGSSAALAAEAAVLSMRRAIKGFVGPRDIFRNPEAVFRWNVKTDGESPFDLVLTHSGKDFAVSRMHFKLGLYEHQSAGALEGLIRLLVAHPVISREPNRIQAISVTAYEPAFSIIGDVAKRDPRTRQSADHSMVCTYTASRVVYAESQEAGKAGSDVTTFLWTDEALE
ncbi:putative MmgE/PrpD family domain containing protein [Neospora caninum Liverpool]|uniref:MmgE/PrpD family domain containing protein,putative n=1 Tax=Neospora caninum (strain Liverpool) TaxID=572307 RepID=F0VD33_NEOCL|nr:putative MmgE/PrpD family domain containing protein [Neospora caninum Liverpool]CBZ51548.1 putative MmgE/PrpD family domain containing protein [Neospora caninum Liverpool]CEL65499.1 TPA: MmgE/PrpD family domain containing protein,putative [Neospora caninum Liverpool]|eukprot:XP_003881581.1 putative MmgE/PrpD family domain containing protein [Neospora caninum Liverpool]